MTRSGATKALIECVHAGKRALGIGMLHAVLQIPARHANRDSWRRIYLGLKAGAPVTFQRLDNGEIVIRAATVTARP